MESVLIVSSSEKGIAYFTELIQAYAPFDIAALDNGGQARRELIEMDYDLVLINAPLRDEFGHELAELVARNTTAGVLLVVKSDFSDEVADKVADDGIFVVPKPVSRPFFFQTLKMVAAARNRLLGLKNENIKLQQKIEEIRLVDRAKCALIQYLNMDEAQAHRYIEKQAMDLRVSRGKVAQSILNTYEC